MTSVRCHGASVMISESDSATSDIEVISVNELLTAIDTDSPVLVSERTDPLSPDDWLKCMDSDGRVLHELSLRRAIFKGGIDKKIRCEVWRFMFGLYPFSSTCRERPVLAAENYAKYHALKSRWKELLQVHAETGLDPQVKHHIPVYLRECMAAQKARTDDQEPLCNTAEEPGQEQQLEFVKLTAKFHASRQHVDLEKLHKTIQIIDKDVPRTDRNMQYFHGQGNHNLVVLREILITYAAYHQDVGYVQGMNDILSRFLVVLDSEAEAYCCFASYLDHVQNDFLENGMLNKVEIVQKLLKKMDPMLFDHLNSHCLGDLLFVHRWLILSFKREFCFDDALTIFEIITSQHLDLCSMEAEKEREKQRVRELEKEGGAFRAGVVNIDTDYTFEAFICLAVLKEYRQLMLTCKEVSTLYNIISSLSMKMDLNVILLKAEELFFNYCRKSVVDCFQLVDGQTC